MLETTVDHLITAIVEANPNEFDMDIYNKMEHHHITPDKRLSSGKDYVLKEDRKNVGIITLNRPDVMNTLTWPMLSDIYHTLKKWETEKTLVVVKGAGDEAFSAGADMKFLMEDIKNNISTRDRLALYINANAHLLWSYKIPYVALINGITMGGGVGLSIHGRYQVASEKTVWAMPETKIGFFPNVGGSYFLSRLPRKLGMFLGLTGKSLKGPDVVNAGLASHYCESNHFELIEEKLLDCRLPEQVEKILADFNKTELPIFSLAPVMHKIEYCFSGNTLEEIMLRLEADGSNWAEETFTTLNALPPKSLKVTMRQLQKGEHQTMKDCMIMELRLMINFVKYTDFHEGVRALIIDKLRKPQWNPSTFSQVSEELIQDHFLEVPNEKLQIDLLG